MAGVVRVDFALFTALSATDPGAYVGVGIPSGQLQEWKSVWHST